MRTELDMIVVGGGMVGAATALGLARLGFNLALVEKNPLPTFSPDAAYDLRISAISLGSIRLLEKLGVWQQVQAMRTCPYTTLETWETEGSRTTFSAADLGLEKLGDMVENNLIQTALWQALKPYPNCLQAVEFSEFFANRTENGWELQVDDRLFAAPMLIAADGAGSQVRQWAGIGLTGWQYRHHCLLATLKTEKPAGNTTWQQFYPSGPRALLPLSGNHACAVWYDSPERIAELKSLSAEKLTAAVRQHFPPRLTDELGEIHVVRSGAFPLSRQHARHYVRNGVVLTGDAAHTINPLAGQGVNLGFKDVKVLLDVLEQAVKKGENVADERVLKRYEQRRKPDNLLMQTAMDIFYKTFKTDMLPLKIARNVGLLLADKAVPLKKQALKYAIGVFER